MLEREPLPAGVVQDTYDVSCLAPCRIVLLLQL
jgi:hypothetical protein